MTQAEIDKLRQEKAELIADRQELERKDILFKQNMLFFGSFTEYAPRREDDFTTIILSYIDGRVYEIEQMLNEEFKTTKS